MAIPCPPSASASHDEHSAYTISRRSEASYMPQPYSVEGARSPVPSIWPVVPPFIVKPCKAWGSQGVYRASKEDDLDTAISRARESAHGADILVEHYAEGPEIDANFVLQNDEILFFELVDGFPCTPDLDSNSDGARGDFLETDQLWPTKHPRKECDIVKNALHSLLQGMGIHGGVFHLEARIENSTMQYTVQDGIMDLRSRMFDQDDPSLEPSVFLLEINQRPPGHGGSWGTALAHGIDYPALHMLHALGDHERFRALSRPFLVPDCTVDSVFINSSHAGTYEGEDVCKELAQKRPDLMETVAYSNCYYQRGDTVSDCPARIALFVVASQASREAVLAASCDIRNAVEVLVRDADTQCDGSPVLERRRGLRLVERGRRNKPLCGLFVEDQYLL